MVLLYNRAPRLQIRGADLWKSQIWNQACMTQGTKVPEMCPRVYFPISFRIFQFVVMDTVKGFGRINKAEKDVFLEFSCLFNDLANIGNLISGFSAFSKTSLNIWKFMVHILLKPVLENFEHYFTSM